MFATLGIVGTLLPHLTKFNYSLEQSLDHLQPIPFHSLRPLPTCSRLTHVCIALQPWVSLTNDELEALARAWPLAVSVEFFESSERSWDPPHPTLAGFIPFAQHCRRLEYLQLAIDARERPPSCSVSPSLSLTKLSVGRSPISENAEEVALFLKKLFPLMLSVGTE